MYSLLFLGKVEKKRCKAVSERFLAAGHSVWDINGIFDPRTDIGQFFDSLIRRMVLFDFLGARISEGYCALYAAERTNPQNRSDTQTMVYMRLVIVIWVQNIDLHLFFSTFTVWDMT